MKKLFYHLQVPSTGNPHQIYGSSECKRRFGIAEWSEKAVGLSKGRIGLPIGSPRVDLSIVLTSPKIGDFVWTWYGDCIVTESTLSLFRQANFTGFETRPVTIEKIKYLSRRRTEACAVPPLWELLIKGKGGDAAPESGIYPLCEIEESGELLYSSFRSGIIVDEANWDGSDFFTVNGYPGYILVTERVKDFMIAHQLTNCALIPSHEVEWLSGFRPEEWMEQKREMASRDLDSLLADLEGSDESNHLDTIHALGEKGDPLALHELFRKFDHPNPLIWGSAASAVAAIFHNKNTSEQVREEIFSMLSGLLGHGDPQVRRSAATAPGSVRGERAAEQVMRLFEDPDELVRDRGVFVVGILRHKPALEAVRRLTRDRSKEVRETARRVLRELSAEFS